MPSKSKEISDYERDLVPRWVGYWAVLAHSFVAAIGGGLIFIVEDWLYYYIVIPSLVFNFLIFFFASSRYRKRMYELGTRISELILAEVSHTVADIRKQKLNDLEIGLALVEEPRLINNELLDGIEYRRLPEEEIEAYTAIQQWYMKKPELLLAERAIDGLHYVINNYNKENENNIIEFPNIIIRKLFLKSKLYFDYELVFETHRPITLKQIVTPYLKWFGIQISILPLKGNIKYFNSCIEPGGKAGNAGGGIRQKESYNQSFSVTCGHVPSPVCKSIVLLSLPDGKNYKPDVALLDSQSPCLKVSPKNEKTVETASINEVDIVKERKIAIRKVYPSKQTKRKGEVENRVASFLVEGVEHRFPHLIVVPKFIDRLFFIAPLFNRRFSSKGNSGSWVIECATNKFIGMVVAGKEPPHYISYLIEAEPLIAYLEAKLKTKIETVIF